MVYSKHCCLCSLSASGNSSKNLEETLLDGVANESAIVHFPPFCSCDLRTGNKLCFSNDTEHVRIKKSGAKLVWFCFATDVRFYVKLHSWCLIG